MTSTNDNLVVNDLAAFDVPLLSQPEFFVMSEDQSIAIMANI